MPVGQINISGFITGLQGGSRMIGPLTINASSAVASARNITITTAGINFDHAQPGVMGTAIYDIPSGATAMLLVPPSSAGSTTAVTLKGVTGDTGFEISLSIPTLLGLPSASTTDIWLIAAGANIVYEVIFI